MAGSIWQRSKTIRIYLWHLTDHNPAKSSQKQSLKPNEFQQRKFWCYLPQWLPTMRKSSVFPDMRFPKNNKKLRKTPKLTDNNAGNVQKITRTESASQYFSMTFKGNSSFYPDEAGKTHVMIREIFRTFMLHKTLRKESLSSPNDFHCCYANFY